MGNPYPAPRSNGLASPHPSRGAPEDKGCKQASPVPPRMRRLETPCRSLGILRCSGRHCSHRPWPQLGSHPARDSNMILKCIQGGISNPLPRYVRSQPCLAEQHPLRPFSLQHAPCRAVSAMTIEGAAPSLSMCQMSICAHVPLGVPGNRIQLFTINEENWTRNDMDMPWL